MLVLSAAQNAILEETIMIGFLYTRLRQLNWPIIGIIAFSALIRGSYHLYQGFGGFAGNLIMGVVFGLIYLRWKRVGPLVVAHTLLDVTAFVGYALVAPRTSPGSSREFIGSVTCAAYHVMTNRFDLEETRAHEPEPPSATSCPTATSAWS